MTVTVASRAGVLSLAGMLARMGWPVRAIAGSHCNETPSATRPRSVAQLVTIRPGGG